MSASTWVSHLDEYERQLISTEHALTTGETFDPAVLQPFVPPVGLGPFPTELGERAAALLVRNEALTIALRDAMVGVQEELFATRKESSAARGYDPSAKLTVSKYFDQPA